MAREMGRLRRSAISLGSQLFQNSCRKILALCVPWQRPQTSSLLKYGFPVALSRFLAYSSTVTFTVPWSILLKSVSSYFAFPRTNARTSAPTSEIAPRPFNNALLWELPHTQIVMGRRFQELPHRKSRRRGVKADQIWIVDAVSGLARVPLPYRYQMNGQQRTLS